MSSIFTDDKKYNTFVNSITSVDKVKDNQSLIGAIKQTCEEIKLQHKKEHDSEIKKFDDIEKGEVYKQFETFTITEFDTKVSYTTDNVGNNLQKKNRLKNLYSDVNVNTNNKTYNGKVKFV